MTLEEVKQLKPGDRVLVEAEIRGDKTTLTVNEEGNVSLFLKLSKPGLVDFAWVKPEAVREKLRNRFKKGDIVAVKNEAIYYVAEDEQEGVKVYLSATGKDTWDVRLSASMLTLICAAEDRADRSAAADGSGVTRKGGEV